jgi:hypothetical protein
MTWNQQKLSGIGLQPAGSRLVSTLVLRATGRRDSLDAARCVRHVISLEEPSHWAAKAGKQFGLFHVGPFFDFFEGPRDTVGVVRPHRAPGLWGTIGGRTSTAALRSRVGGIRL